jgi:hypothetical protein
MRHHSPVRVLALAPLDGRVHGDGALTCVATNSRTPTINLREFGSEKVRKKKLCERNEMWRSFMKLKLSECDCF